MGRPGSPRSPGKILICALAIAAARAEEPVGLIFESRNATIQRPGRELLLAAVPGTALFSGDILRPAAARPGSRSAQVRRSKP